MNPVRHTDGLLTASVAIVLLLAVSFIVYSAFELRSRQMDLTELSLQRSQHMIRLRLDGMFREFGEDLRVEASELTGPIDTFSLDRKWHPLLTSHWAIMAIRLADEHGNEIEYSRNEDTLLLILTKEGSKERPPIILDPITRDTIDPTRSFRTVEADYDPRQRIWFSKALENTRDEPTWNIKSSNDSASPLLQVSTLIRSTDPEEPFRILEMDVDLSRSSWIDTRTTTLNHYGMMLLDGNGQRIRIPDIPRDAVITEAEAAAADHWSGNRSASPFSVHSRGVHYRVLVMAYSLNGLTLYTGVLLDLEAIAGWTVPERQAIMIMACFVLLLCFLLAWMALRKRKETARLKRQARRSRTQEKKLAKAIGEREVLNREVHHRVKNNLQVVSSLLNLQATRLDDGPVKNEFIRGKKRIDLIALVHHKLYGLKDLRNVDVDHFFRDLITALAAIHLPQSRTVSFEVDTNDLHADQDTAIELGIILCELVSNCYQHAFPYATGGHVDIVVRQVENDLYRLIVKDNGQGLREGYAAGPGKLGLEIVDALAEQLDGSFHVRESGGVSFEVLFRMSRQPYADPLEA